MLAEDPALPFPNRIKEGPRELIEAINTISLGTTATLTSDDSAVPDHSLTSSPPVLIQTPTQAPEHVAGNTAYSTNASTHIPPSAPSICPTSGLSFMPPWPTSIPPQYPQLTSTLLLHSQPSAAPSPHPSKPALTQDNPPSDNLYGPNGVELHLSKSMRIHLVMNISHVKPYKEHLDGQPTFHPGPVEVTEE
ncbi:hypothetical protein L210DRAFT_986178 [Boletus edulis BED1]|uniref:Uncharacterized protein n=1 Tax=Boletus edulis BED1 TaxID=1328754 RepID=A0AAD4BV20_BOLED|nr:hypothetical protein L210DRAFT_986178 [Boletus edulis BED1]